MLPPSAFALIATLLTLPALAYCGDGSKDVAAFQERRKQCDHFRGEEPYSKDRERVLAEQIKKYCSGTDAELAKLKRKYARDGAVMKTLNSYEERIE